MIYSLRSCQSYPRKNSDYMGRFKWILFLEEENNRNELGETDSWLTCMKRKFLFFLLTS